MKSEQHNADVKRVTVFLKALANDNRLVILRALSDGEKNVSELEEILGIRQPTLSQQLARLRADNLVSTRRQSKQIFYRLQSEEALLVVELVFDLFRGANAPAASKRPEAAKPDAAAA